jgi:DNA replication protein DnaC
MNTKQHTNDKLYAMRLHGMLDALEEQRQDPQACQLDFEERLAMMVERQWLWKQDRALATRLKYANFKIKATPEEIDYTLHRGLKRAQIQQLRDSDWVQHHNNCLIIGKTGLGKTFIACALGTQACRDGYRALYFYSPKLFRQLQIAQADGSLIRLLNKLQKADLLIIDDLGISNATAQQYRDLLEVIDDRTHTGSTMITSQLPVDQWHQILGDATVADAILDRIVHNAFKIEMDGESVRKKEGRKRKNKNKQNPSDKGL